MSRVDVAHGAVPRIDLHQDQGDEAIGGARLDDVLVEPLHEFGRSFHRGASAARAGGVDQQAERRVQRGDEEGRRHPLAGDVGDHHSAARTGELQKAVVVAPDLARGPAPAHGLEAADARHVGRQDALLDLGREFHLALQPLLLEGLAMEVRVGQCDRRLVREQGERPAVRGREGSDAGSALLVGDHQQADVAAAAVAFDRHGERVLGGRNDARRRFLEGGSVGARGRGRIDHLLGAAADRAGQRQPAFRVPQVEGAPPGVQQRHGAEQDLLGQLLQVQGRGDRQSDIVDRLQRDHVVVVVELPVLQFVRQLAQTQTQSQNAREFASHGRPGALPASPGPFVKRVVEDQIVLQAGLLFAEYAPGSDRSAVPAVDLGAGQAVRPAPLPYQPRLNRTALPLRDVRRRRQAPGFAGTRGPASWRVRTRPTGVH